MLDKLAGVAARYDEINTLLADQAVASDYEKVAALAQERSGIEPIAEGYAEYRTVLDQIAQAQALIDGDDADMRALAEEELGSLETRQGELESELRTLLLPKDPRDDKNVILEVRAGAGGDEA